MCFAASIYVTEGGAVIGAASTDQAHTTAAVRTYGGRPVAYAGSWFGIQMNYRPFKRAVARAQAEARRMANASLAALVTVPEIELTGI